MCCLCEEYTSASWHCIRENGGELVNITRKHNLDENDIMIKIVVYFVAVQLNPLNVPSRPSNPLNVPSRPS